MKLLPALLLLLSSPQAAVPTAGDARAVVAAVLAYEAGHVRSGGTSCVAQKLGHPLVWQQILRSGDRVEPRSTPVPPPLNDGEGSFLQRPLDPTLLERPQVNFDSPGSRPSWFEPRAVGDDSIESRPVDPVTNGRINARLDEALAALPAKRLPRIGAGLVPRPLRPFRTHRRCRTHIALSAPAFVGGTAFVEVSASCGSGCGGGAIYAVVKREGRWTLLARTGMFVA